MLGSGNDHLFAYNNFTDMCYEGTRKCNEKTPRELLGWCYHELN